MVKIDEQRRNTIREARYNAITNARRLTEEGRQLFTREEYPLACFSAITAIEEVGKCILLRHAEGTEMEQLGIDMPDKIHAGKVEEYLSDHRDKATNAVAQSLRINASADQRHGKHPESDVHITSGLILLIRAGEWMDIRNKCLYTDMRLKQNTLEKPCDNITKSHAYYFICMAFEIIAEQVESGIGSILERGPDIKETYEFRDEVVHELKEFMNNWSDETNINQLDFLRNPERLRKKAEE